MSDIIKNRSNDTLNDITNEYEDQEEKVAKNIVSQAVREARNEFMKQQLTSTLNDNYDHLTSNSRTAINDLDEIVKVDEKHSVAASQFRLNITIEMDNSDSNNNNNNNSTKNNNNHTYTQLDEIKFYKLNKKGYDLMLDRLNSIFILLIIPVFLALSKRK